jgi:hypothetical protein
MQNFGTPFGPTIPAASVANQTGMNVQASLAGPLPVLTSLVGTAETLILNALLTGQPLTCQLMPNDNYEQAVFDLVASGYTKTTASGTITFKLYEGASATIGSNTLLGSSGAITQNSATAAWFAHARLIFDSQSGTLAGDIEFYVNKIKVASVTLSNFPTGFLNSGNPSANPATVANLPIFTITAASSGAGSGTPTTVNVQKFSCG